MVTDAMSKEELESIKKTGLATSETSVIEAPKPKRGGRKKNTQ